MNTYKLQFPITLDCSDDSSQWPPSVNLIMAIAFEAENVAEAKEKVAAMFSNSALVATSTTFVE